MTLFFAIQYGVERLNICGGVIEYSRKLEKNQQGDSCRQKQRAYNYTERPRNMWIPMVTDDALIDKLLDSTCDFQGAQYNDEQGYGHLQKHGQGKAHREHLSIRSCYISYWYMCQYLFCLLETAARKHSSSPSVSSPACCPASVIRASSSQGVWLSSTIATS